MGVSVERHGFSLEIMNSVVFHVYAVSFNTIRTHTGRWAKTTIAISVRHKNKHDKKIRNNKKLFSRVGTCTTLYFSDFETNVFRSLFVSCCLRIFSGTRVKKISILFPEFFSPVYGEETRFYSEIKKNHFPFNVIYTDYTIHIVYFTANKNMYQKVPRPRYL